MTSRSGMAATLVGPSSGSSFRCHSGGTTALATSEVAVWVIVTGFDLLVWLATSPGQLTLAHTLVVHLSLVIGSALFLLRPQATIDRALAVIALVCLLVTGPLGGLGAIAMMQIASRNRGDIRRLASWYERLSASVQVDAPSRLHERLAAGRVPRLVAGDIRQLAKVMRHGSDRAREIVLGLIGRHYNPDCRHLLDCALASRQSSVRVQAAAVFVKLRARYKGLLKRCLAQHSKADLEHAQRREIVRDLVAALESGFLDSSEARQAQSATQRLSSQLEQAEATGTAVRSKLHIKPEAPELQRLHMKVRQTAGCRLGHQTNSDLPGASSLLQPVAAALPAAAQPSRNPI